MEATPHMSIFFLQNYTYILFRIAPNIYKATPISFIYSLTF